MRLPPDTKTVFPQFLLKPCSQPRTNGLLIRNLVVSKMLFSVNPIVFDYHLLFVLCFAQGLALVWRILNFTRIQFGFHTLHISQSIRGLVIGSWVGFSHTFYRSYGVRGLIVGLLHALQILKDPWTFWPSSGFVLGLTDYGTMCSLRVFLIDWFRAAVWLQFWLICHCPLSIWRPLRMEFHLPDILQSGWTWLPKQHFCCCILCCFCVFCFLASKSSFSVELSLRRVFVVSCKRGRCCNIVHHRVRYRRKGWERGIERERKRQRSIQTERGEIERKEREREETERERERRERARERWWGDGGFMLLH